MVFLKRSLLLCAGLMLMLMTVAACGETTTTAPATPAATSAAASGPLVKTATVTIDGKATTVLTNAQGFTLYIYMPDTATKTACTGGCAANWPPLLFTGTGKPTANGQVPGVLAVYANENGKQVTYNYHPLYTFVGDTAAGQATGQGKAGVWYVATPDLAKL